MIVADSMIVSISMNRIVLLKEVEDGTVLSLRYKNYLDVVPCATKERNGNYDYCIAFIVVCQFFES